MALDVARLRLSDSRRMTLDPVRRHGLQDDVTAMMKNG